VRRSRVARAGSPAVVRPRESGRMGGDGARTCNDSVSGGALPAAVNKAAARLVPATEYHQRSPPFIHPPLPSVLFIPDLIHPPVTSPLLISFLPSASLSLSLTAQLFLVSLSPFRGPAPCAGGEALDFTPLPTPFLVK
jgi:hypothetical protein